MNTIRIIFKYGWIVVVVCYLSMIYLAATGRMG